MGAVAIANDDRQIISPKDRLAWLASRGHLSFEQRDAGDMLNKLRERKTRVAYASANGTGARANLNPLEARATAERQYDRAMTAMTPLGAAVFVAVVLDNLSLEDAGRVCGIHPKGVLPVLTVALDILRHQYNLP